VFENRFPSLRPHPPPPAVLGSDLYAVAPALGVCEVVVYTPEHETSLASLPVPAIEELIWVWRDRYAELSAREEVRYVYLFENRGYAVGVTLHHPHGQVYAFPFVPSRIERELESIALHREATGRCLVCDVVAAERAARERLVACGRHFAAAVPFYARWPYEVHVWANRHAASLAALDPAEVQDLAAVLKQVLTAYDALWGFPMPYLMGVKQLPTDGRGAEADHLRIDFCPPFRAPDRLKFTASVETGAGPFINDTQAEAKAAELRAALARAPAVTSTPQPESAAPAGGTGPAPAASAPAASRPV
jgi:UDPglucose--hexose-1-phosphate uridylyltransferase